MSSKLEEFRLKYSAYDMSDAKSGLASGIPDGFELLKPPAATGLPEGFELVSKPDSSKLPPAARQPGFLERASNLITGADRTEYPDAPEFMRAAIDAGNLSAEDTAAGRAPAWTPDSIMRSAITSDPKAQLEILQKQIPGLEAKQDRHGNLMLKTPMMKEFAYLNKPGISSRDIDELGTQLLATLPFMGSAGVGQTVGTRIATGATMTAAAEAEKNLLAKAQGSTQDLDPKTLLADMALGGALVPGAPSAIVQGATRIATNNPIANSVRGAVNPAAEAERRVAEMYQRTHGLSQNGQRLEPERLQNLAANQIMVRDAAENAAQGGTSTLMDVMGEQGAALARSAANTSDAARSALNQVIQPRLETQAPRITSFIESMVGGNNANASRDVLEQMAYNARAPFYQRAFQDGAGGIRDTPLLQALTRTPAVQDAMQAAEITLQNRAGGGRLITAARNPQTGARTLEYWDEVKRNLQDQYARLADRSPSNAGHIHAITERLIAELDNQVPSYMQARGVSSGIFRANNALDAGENFARGIVSVRDAERGIQVMTKQERDLFAQGFIGKYLENVNKTGDRRNLPALLLTSPDARERVAVAIGPNRMRELDTMLHVERLNSAAISAVNGNSTTARQLFELGLAGGAGAVFGGFDITNPAGWLAAVMTKFGANKAGQHVDQRVARQVSEMLVSRDPAVMRRGAQIASANGPILRALKAADEAISGPAGRVLRNQAAQGISE